MASNDFEYYGCGLWDFLTDFPGSPMPLAGYPLQEVEVAFQWYKGRQI